MLVPERYRNRYNDFKYMQNDHLVICSEISKSPEYLLITNSAQNECPIIGGHSFRIRFVAYAMACARSVLAFFIAFETILTFTLMLFDIFPRSCSTGSFYILAGSCLCD